MTTTGGPRSASGNVVLHRINAAARLGGAGPAVSHARPVHPGQLTVTERQAALFAGTAHAFSPWGKHDKADHALRAAANIAPQEPRSRPAARRLVGDLPATAPPAVRPHLSQFAAHLGAPP